MLLLHTFLVQALAHKSCRSLSPATLFYNDIASSMNVASMRSQTTTRTAVICLAKMTLLRRCIWWAFLKSCQQNYERAFVYQENDKRQHSVYFKAASAVTSKLWEHCHFFPRKLSDWCLIIDVFFFIVWNFKYGTSKMDLLLRFPSQTSKCVIWWPLFVSIVLLWRNPLCLYRNVDLVSVNSVNCEKVECWKGTCSWRHSSNHSRNS